MGNSVTRVIWVNDDILISGCITCGKAKEHKHTVGSNIICQYCPRERKKEATAKWEVINLLKRIPKGNLYTVRYVLDKKGPFLAVMKTIMVLINIKTNEDMSACFLPKNWNGKRVRRLVIPIIYENGKNL